VTQVSSTVSLRSRIPYRYLGRRLGLYVLILWAAVTLNYLLPRLMPGDPVEIYVARMRGQVSPDAIDALRQAFGLTSSNPIAGYLDYLGSIAHGRLGISISQYPTTVGEIIRQTLPWTVVLVGVSTVVSFVLGTYLGAVIAWRRTAFLEGLVPVATFLQAIPFFWLASLLVYIFGIHLDWLPVSSGYDTSMTPAWTWPFVSSVLVHGILPALSIIISSLAGWVLRMRNMMITTQSEEYVTLAIAKGLSSRRVMLQYAARNAILPSVTEFSLAIGFVVGGSLLTEVVFAYPGIGNALFQAVQNEDYPLMQGIFLIISIAVIVASFLADALYTFLDPRTGRDS
jgi:peptide/nickel transport system permease protein